MKQTCLHNAEIFSLIVWFFPSPCQVQVVDHFGWDAGALTPGLGSIYWIKCSWQILRGKCQANLQSIATHSRNICFLSSSFHSPLETILAKMEEIVGCPLTCVALFSISIFAPLSFVSKLIFMCWAKNKWQKYKIWQGSRDQQVTAGDKRRN